MTNRFFRKENTCESCLLDRSWNDVCSSISWRATELDYPPSKPAAASSQVWSHLMWLALIKGSLSLLLIQCYIFFIRRCCPLRPHNLLTSPRISSLHLRWMYEFVNIHSPFFFFSTLTSSRPANGLTFTNILPFYFHGSSLLMEIFGLKQGLSQAGLWISLDFGRKNSTWLAYSFDVLRTGFLGWDNSSH